MTFLTNEFISNHKYELKIVLLNPKLADSLLKLMNTFHQKSDPGLAPITKRLREILEYNTVGGKLNRGCAVVHTAQLLGCNDTLNAHVLGWCVEILQVQ